MLGMPTSEDPKIALWRSAGPWCRRFLVVGVALMILAGVGLVVAAYGLHQSNGGSMAQASPDALADLVDACQSLLRWSVACAVGSVALLGLAWIAFRNHD